MCVSEQNYVNKMENNKCVIEFQESPTFNVVSNVGRSCKSGEKFNGDSFTFGKFKNENYIVVISDGMGSGPEAGKESKVAIDLIEKFMDAGFDRMTAINTINSVMSLKFSDDEKFSTVDMLNIDLYTGEMDMMKVGAVATYLKTDNKVEVIKSRTLPIGVLDKVDVDIINRTVKNGDIIVMLSDGVLECRDNNSIKEDWIKEYLENTPCINPKDMVDEIMNKARELNNGKIKDDMTLIVSKVYGL
jgi:stage II sporulation protein E